MCGIPEDKLVEAHGNFTTASCHLCYTPYPAEDAKVRGRHALRTSHRPLIPGKGLKHHSASTGGHHEWRHSHVFLLCRNGEAWCGFLRRRPSTEVLPAFWRLPQSRSPDHYGNIITGKTKTLLFKLDNPSRAGKIHVVKEIATTISCVDRF